MIAWNSAGSNPDIDLHATSSIPETLVLAQLFADVVDAYNLNLIPSINPNGTGASDHASFWQYGYTAILGIEDGGDFNPYYHTTNDNLDNLQDLPYYTDFVKASVATFAHMSDCLISAGQAFPSLKARCGVLDRPLDPDDPESPTIGMPHCAPNRNWRRIATFSRKAARSDPTGSPNPRRRSSP